ncbi:hypothetical protein TTHERM_00691450 (macronuclear) [Tetrahymena thermophila SB210]|uniref:RING-type domain-containing protein n=1 Tax=Tetrahymena thermophila (strain SB210) TaxID=312017 RepID=I7LZP0_TETTS|nr:hypothetical protein TTHERM_00691450 [Tetrahymena thermophila SB210]EAR84447.1 hypothetical protein TTHERM_00691450 [Tetrahymena thermophila SB210]|eukprot:XP_001032110.1 hypothetical protein TTHERM_00691450 [Tetrahymena thermophila SB210]
MKKLITQNSFSLNQLDSFSNLPDQKGTESEQRLERNASSCPEENIQQLLSPFITEQMKRQDDEIWSQGHNNSQIHQFYSNGGKNDISNNVSHLQESNLNDFSYDDDEENKNITIGGIPLQNIYENSEWIKPFQCFLCNNVAVQPIRCTSCSGLFCKGCILSWESRNELRKVCPKCQNQQSFNISTQESELKPDYNTQKFLQDINVDCVYKKNGCQDIITYAEYEDHVKNCPKRMKICLNCGENFIYDQSDLHKNLCQLQSIQMDNNRSISEYSIRPSQLGFQSDLKTFSDLPSIGGSNANIYNNQFGTNKNAKPKRNSEKIHVRNFKQNQNKGRFDSPHSLSYINPTLQQIQENNSMNQIEEMCIHENEQRQQQQMYLENSKIEEESQLLNQTESNKQVDHQISLQKVRNSDRQTGSNNNSGIYNEQNNSSYINQNNQSIDKQNNQLNAIQVQPQQVISISQNNSHLIIGISFLILILLSLLLFNQYTQTQQTKQEINDNTISKIYKDSFQFQKEIQEYLNQIREKYNNFQHQQQNEITSVKSNIENYINSIKLLQQSQDEQLKTQIISKVQEQNDKIIAAVNNLKQDYETSLKDLIRKQEFFQNDFTKFKSNFSTNDQKIEQNNQMIISQIKSDLDAILERQLSIQLAENNNALKQVVSDLSSIDLFIKKQDHELQQIKQIQTQQQEIQSEQNQLQKTSDKLYQQFYETLQSNITAIHQNLNHQINNNKILFQEQMKILTTDIKNLSQNSEENKQILQNDNKEVKNLIKTYNLELKTSMEEILIQIKDLNKQMQELQIAQQKQSNNLSQKYEQAINQIQLNKEQSEQQQKQIYNNLNEKLSQQDVELQKKFDNLFEQISVQIQKQIKNNQIDYGNEFENIKQELNKLRQLFERLSLNQLNVNNQQLPNNQVNNNTNQGSLFNSDMKEYFEQHLTKIYQDLNLLKQFNNNQNQLIQQLTQNQPSKQNYQDIQLVINKLTQDVQNISLEISQKSKSEDQNQQNQYKIIQNQINQMAQQLDNITKNQVIQSQTITQLNSQGQQHQLAEETQIKKLSADVMLMNSMLNKILEAQNKNKEIKIEQLDLSELKQNLELQLEKFIKHSDKQAPQLQEIQQQIQMLQQVYSQENQKLAKKLEEDNSKLIELKQQLENIQKQLLNLNSTQIILNQNSQNDINQTNQPQDQKYKNINQANQQQQIEYSQVIIPFNYQGEEVKVQKLNYFQVPEIEDGSKFLGCNSEIIQELSFGKNKPQFSPFIKEIDQTVQIKQITTYYNQLNQLVSLQFEFKNSSNKLKCGNIKNQIFKTQSIQIESQLIQIQKDENQFVLIISKH